MDVRSPTRTTPVFHPEFGKQRRRQRRMRSIMKVAVCGALLLAIVALSISLVALLTGGYL